MGLKGEEGHVKVACPRGKQLRADLAHDGAELESVAGAGRDEEHVPLGVPRVPVQEKT